VFQEHTMNTSMEYFPVVVYAVAFFVGPVVLGAIGLFWLRRHRP